jgi:non-ribosomal peptide synthetase component F
VRIWAYPLSNRVDYQIDILTLRKFQEAAVMAVLDTSKDLVANFLVQVRATPDAPALEDAESTWTYAELDRLTASLASHLQSFDVGRDDLVGVLMGRCADYVIASLAALLCFLFFGNYWQAQGYC